MSGNAEKILPITVDKRVQPVFNSADFYIKGRGFQNKYSLRIWKKDRGATTLFFDDYEKMLLSFFEEVNKALQEIGIR